MQSRGCQHSFWSLIQEIKLESSKLVNGEHVFSETQLPGGYCLKT